MFDSFEWWQTILVFVSIFACVAGIGATIIWVSGALRSSGTDFKATGTRGRSVSIVGGRKTNGTGVNGGLTDVQPFFDHRNWHEVLMRMNDVIHASFRKGQIIYYERNEEQRIPMKKARSSIIRIFESRYIQLYASKTKDHEEGPMASASRDFRDFKLIIHDAADVVTEYMWHLFQEDFMESDESVFDIRLREETQALMGEFKSFLTDFYFPDSVITPKELHKGIEDLYPKMESVLSDSIRRARSIALEKREEVEAIDKKLQQYGVKVG